MKEQVGQALREFLAHFGEQVTVTTNSGEIILKAMIDTGLDEYGIEESIAILPDGAWVDDNPTFMDIGQKRYKIIDLRRGYGDVYIKLEGSR